MNSLALLLIVCSYILGAATVVAGLILYSWRDARKRERAERDAAATAEINRQCVERMAAKAPHLTPMQARRMLRELERQNVVRLTRNGPEEAA